ncbi:unnamed protein product [Ostreobium quekettii]|uniref:Uncharacterized protein n=1 Tax=Ostreobium quekettii TaxID=121088 RepID=A0A8S1J5E8_9CHLO|nr:unnamed protein product [Ostreobium quekettii]
MAKMWEPFASWDSHGGAQGPVRVDQSRHQGTGGGVGELNSKIRHRKMGSSYYGHPLSGWFWASVRDARLHAVKVRQRRHERGHLEAIAAGLEESSLLLEAVQRENAVLRADNDRLEAFVQEQRDFIRIVREGWVGRTALHPAHAQLESNVLNESPRVPHQDCMQACSIAAPTAAVVAPDPMKDIWAQVHAMRTILEENCITCGSDRASDAGLNALSKLASAATQAHIRMLVARHPRPSDLATKMPQEVLGAEETAVWLDRLAKLRLNDAQKIRIVDMRVEHLSRLRMLFAERSWLSDEARALVKGSSACPQGLSDELRLVWERVKANVRQCQAIAANGLRTLLMDILDPIRGALLLVDSHPHGVDPMKLAAALVAVDGGWASDAHSSANSTN